MSKRIFLCILTMISISMAHGQSYGVGLALGGIESDYISDYEFDNSGNIYVTGVFQSTVDFDPGTSVNILASSGERDIFLAKYSPAGSLLWVFKLGGNESDIVSGIEIIQDSRIVMFGHFTNTVDFDPGTNTNSLTSAYANEGDFFLANYTLNGILLTVKQIGKGEVVMGANLLTKDTNENLIVTGENAWGASLNFETGTPAATITSFGTFFAKYDKSGAFQYVKLLPATQIGMNKYTAMVIGTHTDIHNNIFITGQYGYAEPATGVTFDFDPGSGNTSTGSPDNNNYILNADIFLAKYDSNGNYQWVYTGGRLDWENERGCAVTSDHNGNIYLTGKFVYQLDLDPGLDVFNVTSSGSDPRVFLASFSPTGSPRWGLCLSDQLVAGAPSVFCDQTDQIYLLSHINSLNDYDPGAGTLIFDSISRNALAIVKYDNLGNFIYAKHIVGYNPYEGIIKVNNDGDIFASGDYNQFINLNSDQVIDTTFNNGLSGPYPNSRDFFLVKYLQTPSIRSQSQSQPVCTGNSITIFAQPGGAPPFSYQWKKNGSDITGANAGTFLITTADLSDEGSYTCEITNSYGQIECAPIQISVIQLTVNAGDNEAICNGSQVQLQASGTSNYPGLSGSLSYQWSPANGLSNTSISNPAAQPVLTTNYLLTLTDANGCQAHDSLLIHVQNPYSNEKICLVSVDPATGKNRIYWEKTTGVGTEYYLIYKENGTNNYTQIGNVAASDPAEYTDLFSQPEMHGDKYKITVLDTCGNESSLGFYHKTINLTIAAFGSTMGLNWDDYVDESGAYIPFRYYIYRGTDPSSMVLFDSVSGSFNSYNDLNVFSLYYYQVGVKKAGGCNTAKSDMTSFSNRINNSDFIGISETSLPEERLMFSPNPMSSYTEITIPDLQNANNDYCCLIYDFMGRLIRTLTKDDIQQSRGFSDVPFRFGIERSSMAPGVYLIEFRGNETYNGKLIIK